MEAAVTYSLMDMFSVLPIKKQKYIEKNIQTYFESLDASIADILCPSIGKTEDNFFLLADEYIPLYGMGKTPKEAMNDYRSVVIEYYENLEKDANELDAELKHQLDILRRIFDKVEGML